MSLKFFFLYLGFSLSFIISAQNTAYFSIDDQNIQRVVFQADQVSNIRLQTQSNSGFKFTSSSEGTYQDDIYFDHWVKQNTLYIKSNYPERLAFGDNKMTSMQDFSVKIDFILPEHLSVDITSNIASVEGNGVFKNLIINTKSGYCHLSVLLGNAIINTYDGNINLKTKHAQISAFSQNGMVNIEDGLIQRNFVDLKSVYGNIKVMQIE